MTIRRITITYDDADISAERAMSVAQITEHNREYGDGKEPYKQLYCTFMSGMNCWCKPKKNGNHSIRVGGRPINPGS